MMRSYTTEQATSRFRRARAISPIQVPPTGPSSRRKATPEPPARPERQDRKDPPEPQAQPVRRERKDLKVRREPRARRDLLARRARLERPEHKEQRDPCA